jgi:hypothetical protein
MSSSQAAAQVARWCAAVLTMVLAALTLGVWVRLLQGRLAQPLTLGQALLISVTSTATAAAIRGCCYYSFIDLPGRVAPLWRWGLTAALLALAVALTLPGSTLQVLLVIWGLIVAEEATAVHLLRRKQGEPRSDDLQPPAIKPQPDEAPTLRPDATQRLIRSRTMAGEDALTGALRARFAPRQRSETLHVAFCPPFAQLPQVQCRQTTGPAVRIKPTQVLAHGVRIELKLEQPSDEATDVVVELNAVVVEGRRLRVEGIADLRSEISNLKSDL